MKAFYSKPTIRTRRHGFTLIELLVVMALTALLFTLALKPLVDTFNLTSRAGTLIESQTSARDVMREIRQTLGNAVYVYDNVQQPINLWVADRNGTLVAKPTRFAIVNYVLPARQGDQFPGAEEIDPTSGGRMNSNNRNLDGYALPLVPGRTIGRIFIGMNNNALNRNTGLVDVPYSNQFLNTGTVDNRYLLFRAEAAAYIFDPNTTGQNRPYIPNLMLFHTVDAQGNVTDALNGALQVHHPNFFYDNRLAGGTQPNAGTRTWAVPGWKDLNGDGQVQISENWRAIAVPLVFSNKADLVTLERDPNTNAIIYDNRGEPIVRPLLQLAPAYKENAPAAAGSTNNIGNEAPNAAPTLFATQNANWANPFRVIVYLTNDNNIDPFSASPLTAIAANGSTDAQGRMLIGTATVRPDQALPPVNSMTQVGPLLNPVTGAFDAPNPSYAMSIDPRRGLINFEFSSGTLLRNSNGVPVPAYFSPVDVNNSLDIVTGLPRSLDLRTLPNALNGGRLSPLAASRNWYNRVKIVPGSERVIGPDQRPGPNYGYPIAYARVSGSTGTVGRNEYKINYEDASFLGTADPNDPRLRKGYIQFRGGEEQFTPNGNQVTNGEDPRNGVFRIFGIPELRYNAMTGANEPTLPIEVTFNFQTNRSKDVVKVDYLTFEQMKIALELRYYDPRTGVPQITSLNDTTNVRNLKR